jgi:hypothetical protein
MLATLRTGCLDRQKQLWGDDATKTPKTEEIFR